jgi:hypothetical protein
VNDYEIVALEKICGDNSYRETIEKLWMNKLRTFKLYINQISENLFGAFGRTTRPSSAELYYVRVHLNLS